MASVERTLFVGADYRVRPGVRFTLRPIRSRDQTPQEPLWAGTVARPYSSAVRNAGYSDLGGTSARYDRAIG